MKVRRAHRVLVGRAASILGFVVLLWALHTPMLRGISNLLVVEDPVQPADVAVVLGGTDQGRAKRAAQFYLDGQVSRIALARSPGPLSDTLGICEHPLLLTVKILEQLGVDGDSIDLVPATHGAVSSTHDEATALRTYLEQKQSVLLVTSELHTRRARMTFRRVLGDWPGRLGVTGVHHRDFDRRNWWRREQGLVAVNNEWIKLIFYILLRH